MTYRCGIAWPGAPADPPRHEPPRIVCDGCGDTVVVGGRRPGGPPPAWFMDGKAPPGWRLRRLGPGGERRDDRCPRCRATEVLP